MKYKPVPGFPGYRVGRNGTVWTRWQQKRKPKGYGARFVLGRNWKQLQPWSTKPAGYQVATLYRNGKQHRFRVHRMVLELFVGPCPLGYESRHWDGNTRNNCVNNLAWGTSLENHSDRGKHDRVPHGEAVSQSKLSADDVRKIVALLDRGLRQADIAARFKISQASVSSISRGQTWSRITGKGQYCGKTDA